MVAAAPERVRRLAWRIAGPDAEVGAARWRRLELAALGAALALALVVRASGLGDRSFWLDEALVVHTARGPLDRLIPELYTSPVLFVLLERAMFLLPLPPETSLRLPAMLGGVATVGGVFVLARWLGLGGAAAVAAALLCAVNPTLAYYGKEAKPYALDGLAAVVVPLLCEAVRRTPGSRRVWFAFATLMLLPALLYGSVFALLGGDLVLLLALARRRDAWPRLVGVFALQATCAVVLYAFVLRVQVTGQVTEYWAGGFAPSTRSVRVALGWLGERTWDLYVLYFEGLAPIALGLTVLGLAILARERRWRALGYAVLPWLLVLAASAVHLYPYGGHRVLLVLIPGIVLLIAAALALPLRVVHRLGRPLAAIAFVVALAVMAGPALRASLDRFVLRTYHAEEMGPVVEQMRPLVQPGDAVYVYYAARLAFEWYGRDLSVEVVPGTIHRDDVTGYGPEVDAVLTRHRRTWLVFSHYWPGEREWIVTRASERAAQRAVFEEVGASAYLFVAAPADSRPTG